MTRTYVMTLSRPFTDSATSIGRRRSRALRRLLALPVGLLLAIALAAPALAAESGYGNTPKPPSSTPPASTPPASGTSPSKSTSTTPTPSPSEKPSNKEKTPPKEKPIEKESPPTKTTPPAKATLPFTGLDLRWIVGIGLVLMGAGCSLLVAQRRGRRSHR